MNTFLLVLLPATIGVDVGWERYPNGAIEFIVQARPGELNSTGVTGKQLIESLPREYQFIRDYNYRIRTGTDLLPNQGTVPNEYRTLATGGTGFGSPTYNAPTYGAPPYNAPTTIPTTYPTPQPNFAATPNGYTPTPTGFAPSPATTPIAPWGTAGQFPYNPNMMAAAGTNVVGGIPTYATGGPQLIDPHSFAAKPSIELGGSASNAGNFQPNQNYFQQQPYPSGTEPKSPQDAASLAAAKPATTEPSSQWASLTFALVALFASLGANFYLGWTTYHLRERYRLMLADRPTY